MDPVFDHNATLLTIAQVAVAFAGFAGIASVIGQEGSHVKHQVLVIRLRGMVEAALIASFGGLLPSVLATYPLSTANTWRLASVFLLICWLVETVLIWHRFRRLDQLIQSVGYWLFRPLLWTIQMLLGVLLITNVSWSSTLSPALYTTAIAAALVVSAMLFVRLLLGLIPSRIE